MGSAAFRPQKAPATPIRVRALQLFGEAGGAGAEAGRLAEVDRTVGELARLMEFEPTEPLGLQARELMRRSATWLREQAGEERFELFRYLARIAAVDGVLACRHAKPSRVAGLPVGPQLRRRGWKWVAHAGSWRNPPPCSTH